MRDAETIGVTCTEAGRPTTDELVSRCLPVVHGIVADLVARVPRHVSRDDLLSAGMLGLVQAAKGWDPGRGVAFETFARSRIQGALLDELRSRDWASRSVRSKGRRHAEAVNELVRRHGRMPDRAEVATQLGTDVAGVNAIEHDVARADVRSLEAVVDAGEDPVHVDEDPGNLLVDGELKGLLQSAVAALPDRLRKVVVEYFFEERSMLAIAHDLGVTESRISQMRAEALVLLRDGMNAQLEPELVPDLGRRFGRVGRRKNEYYDAVARAATASRSPLATAV